MTDAITITTITTDAITTGIEIKDVWRCGDSRAARSFLCRRVTRLLPRVLGVSRYRAYAVCVE